MPIRMLLRVLALSGLLHTYIGFRLLPDLPLGGLGLAVCTIGLLLSAALAPAPCCASIACSCCIEMPSILYL